MWYKINKTAAVNLDEILQVTYESSAETSEIAINYKNGEEIYVSGTEHDFNNLVLVLTDLFRKQYPNY